MAFERIGVARARELIDDHDAQIVDVRDRASYEVGHIENARHVDEANVMEFVAGADLTRPLIVCCYHGNMSQGAADFFNSKGFHQAYSLDGGYAAWRESNGG
jgi:thiosulfate sulfurtransferase